MINDDSKDDTEKICMQFAKEDTRFKLINKENTGVSDTRNVGVKKAIGKYLFFIDADDYIAQGAWTEIIAHASEGEYDMVAFSYVNQFSDKKMKPMYYQEESDKKTIELMLLSTSKLNTCWGKLLRSEIVYKNNISFHKHMRIGEDTIFILDFFQNANTCLLSPAIVMHYRIHPGSVMQRMDFVDKMVDIETLFIRRESYLEMNYDKMVERAMRGEFFSVLTDLLCFCARKRRIKDISATYRKLLESNEFRVLFEKTNKESIVRTLKKIEFALIVNKWYTFLALYFRLKAEF